MRFEWDNDIHLNFQEITGLFWTEGGQRLGYFIAKKYFGVILSYNRWLQTYSWNS